MLSTLDGGLPALCQREECRDWVLKGKEGDCIRYKEAEMHIASVSCTLQCPTLDRNEVGCETPLLLQVEEGHRQPASKRARQAQGAAATAQPPASPLASQAAAAPPPVQRGGAPERAEASARTLPKAAHDARFDASATHVVAEAGNLSPPPLLLPVFEDRPPPRGGATPPQALDLKGGFQRGSQPSGVGANAAPARRSEWTRSLAAGPPGLGPEGPPGLLHIGPPGLPGWRRGGPPTLAPGGVPGLQAGGPAPARRLSALHGEVLRFAAAAAPTPAEVALVHEALWTVGAAASELWPGSRTVRPQMPCLTVCELAGPGGTVNGGRRTLEHVNIRPCFAQVSFGSQATGLALPNSDLDVAVLGVGPHLARAGSGYSKEQRAVLQQQLAQLAARLRERGALRGKPLVRTLKSCMPFPMSRYKELVKHSSRSVLSCLFIHRACISAQCGENVLHKHLIM